MHQLGDRSTTVYLVRHGETDWNREQRLQGHSDIPLNAMGVLQAERTARRLAQERWTALWSSHLRRARETAEIIGRAVGLEPLLCPELRERGLGPLEGLTFDEVRRRYPEYPAGDPGVEGVEGRAQLRERAMGVLHRLVSEHPGGRLVVVSHGALINAALAVMGNGEVGTGKTRISNASISIVRWEQGCWRVLAVNDVSHLADLTPA